MKKIYKVTVDVSLLSPREREAWEHRLAGKSSIDTAAAMRCNRANVFALWHHAMNRTVKAKDWDMRARSDDRKLTALGRCKCGLLLPCVCLPTLAEVATNRLDAE